MREVSRETFGYARDLYNALGKEVDDIAATIEESVKQKDVRGKLCGDSGKLLRLYMDVRDKLLIIMDIFEDGESPRL